MLNTKYILPHYTNLILTCETSKCKVEICNFDSLFFNQNDCGIPMRTNFALLVCSRLKIRILYILPVEESFDWSCMNLVPYFS